LATFVPFASVGIDTLENKHSSQERLNSLRGWSGQPNSAKVV